MPNQEWKTHNELQYLHSLRNFAYLNTPMGAHHRPSCTEKKLFQNFIASAKRRKEWGTYGNVDVDEVILEAEHILAQIAWEKDL